MTTLQNGDSFLVQRTDAQSGISTNYQVSQENLMANLADDDLLLVQRTSGGISTNYSITGSALKEDLGGPDGLIAPPVSVLTPLNGAGLNDGQSYTPMSSAYVSTDSSPISHRYSYLVETISGGTWDDLNLAFDGDYDSASVLSGAVGEVSQATIYMETGVITEGDGFVYSWATNGGTAEVLDENGTVLRTYALPTTSSTFVGLGIIRPEYKIRLTTTQQNEELKLSAVIVNGSYIEDYIIPGRVAFEFTDDTDLDKMVAPIIQTDENGNVKIPTTSTVDSTTTITGEDLGWYYHFVGNGAQKTISMYSDGIAPSGARMMWAKTDDGRSGVITDNVALESGHFFQTSAAGAPITGNGPILNEGTTVLPVANSWNKNGYNSYIAEIGVAPKVLDIVSYTGDGSSLYAVPHNLGCKPGMIIIKRIDSGHNWVVWHKDLTPGENLFLNKNFGESFNDIFPSEPTKDKFYVGNYDALNANSGQYVAYLFAADTPGKIKCGTYNGTGSQQNISTGMSGGFVLVKRRNGSNNWCAVTDEMTNIGGHRFWEVNTTAQLAGGSPSFSTAGNGFWLYDGNSDYNGTNSPYIYLCISKDLAGPNSTQLNLLSGQDLEYFTTGTQITSNATASGSNISFGSVYQAGDDQLQKAVNPVVDGQYFFDTQLSTGNKWLIWAKSTTADNSHRLYDSERNIKKHLYTNMGNGEFYGTQGIQEQYTSYYGYYVGDSLDLNNGGDNYIYWNFLAAPQFFDVQKYVGTGSGTTVTISHDLGVEPGCIITKGLNNTYSWLVYHSELVQGGALQLNKSSSVVVSPGSLYVDANENNYTVGDAKSVNEVGKDFIAYIFAKDTPYVKCGSYTGAGSSTQVNVGFQPRWMLIKSSTSDSQWIILDKNMNDNTYLKANSSNPQGGLAWDFTSTGVTLVTAWGSVNNPGDTYVYVAIADESEGHPPSPPSTSTVQGTPDVNAATMVVNAESFDVGATASAPALEASITSVAGSDGNKLLVDGSTGTWLPGLYAKGTETTINAPGPDEITFTSTNADTTPFSGVDATLASRTWTLESSSSATGPWTLVDTYVDYDVLNSQDGATPWSSNKPSLTPNTFYRVKVQYNSTNAESVESVYNTFKTGSN